MLGFKIQKNLNFINFFQVRDASPEYKILHWPASDSLLLENTRTIKMKVTFGYIQCVFIIRYQVYLGAKVFGLTNSLGTYCVNN